MFPTATQNAQPQMPANAVLIENCRLSHAELYSPGKDLNGKLKYQVRLLIPKTYNMDRVYASVNAAIQKGIKDKKNWGGVCPTNLILPVRDGDQYYSQKPDKRKSYVGQWFIQCKQDPEFGDPPVMINENRQISKDPREIQSGDYADVVVEFFPYDNRSNGVSAIPIVVRKTATGERFGGGISIADAIAAVGGASEAPQVALPAGYGDVNSLF